MHLLTEETDGEIKSCYVLSLTQTAQTKTKSHNLHDLDYNLLSQKHLDLVKAVRGEKVYR